MNAEPVTIRVAIPTYGRGRVLLETIDRLRPQTAGTAILVIDQTPRHEPEVANALKRLETAGAVSRVAMAPPSIPAAMNRALLTADSELVLFVDDDVVPAPGLIEAHRRAHREAPRAWAVAGQVLQPGEQAEDIVYAGTGTGLRAYLDFPFRSTRRVWIENVMAGNLSVNRRRALSIGGFDENFHGAAYRFETDFARRIAQHGGCIAYEPSARIGHLRVPSGGVRARGPHQASASPDHGVGDYYYALRHGRGWERWDYILRRPFREVATRFHLCHPWWIPLKFIGELRALGWALRLAAGGPKHVSQEAA